MAPVKLSEREAQRVLPADVVRAITGYTIILEDVDFRWAAEDIELVKKWWRQGLDVWQMAKILGRDPDEVGLLLMHLRRQREIKIRPGGAYGWMYAVRPETWGGRN